MKKTGKIKKLLSLFLILVLAAPAAISEGEGIAAIEERGLTLAESSITYPVITGLADEALQGKINDRVLQDCGIMEYLSRMSLLISGGSLRVTWRGGIVGDLFSCVVSAAGQVTTPRNTFVWTACSVDLRSGEPIVWDQLFTDGEEARGKTEEYLQDRVAPELSAHLLNSDLTPIPETFFLEKAGLTLLYPLDQLSTLSGRAGEIRIAWNELREALNLEPESVLFRTGVPEMITLTEKSAAKLRAMAAEGRVEGIPVRIGEALKPWTDEMGLLIDPDVYRDGRLFSLEGAPFRDVFLLTDHLSESWEDSVVDGIRMDRGCVYGLCLGETDQDAWRAALGDPDFTAEIDPETAEAYRTVTGTCDYYACGDHQLQLYADKQGILQSLILK